MSIPWALELFHRTVATVPAYRTFLARQGVEPNTIVDGNAFRRLPLLTKAEYVRAFPLDQICRDGRLTTCDLIAVSSGSSGSPTFWPRSETDQVAVAAAFERIFRGSFQADRRTTLAVVCFPLGTWVGGLYTVDCCRDIARTAGYPMTTVAVGNNLDEVLRVVPALAGHFDQVVLLGYPPFVRSVLDTGIVRGLDWSQYSTKLVLGGELFSEDWRDLMVARTGAASPCFDTASLYGSADAGLLGIETPLTVAIRRFLAARPAIATEFF
ncbi:MAG: phenylacetate--CoA ligase family protein, partial [Kutzneria sp.]|nr:phenylacetate--CoA ligase family protein [Kutzneria sp.]